jgi:adenylate kinase
MNILLFGPQGSGKGTQARLLSEKYGFFYFESGAYLRKLAETNESLKKMLDSGILVPDKEMTSYLTAYLDQEDLYDNIIFDGFPRTVEQYHFLRNWLNDKEVNIDLVIVLKISDEESVRRLSARRLDPSTGTIYNLITEPPPKEIDMSTLVHRDDDKPESIKKRLGLYHSRTQLLINEFEGKTKVVEVNGERSVEEIFADLCKRIDNVDSEINSSK